MVIAIHSPGHSASKYRGTKDGSMTSHLTDLIWELIAQASSKIHVVQNSQPWVLNKC